LTRILPLYFGSLLLFAAVNPYFDQRFA